MESTSVCCRPPLRSRKSLAFPELPQGCISPNQPYSKQIHDLGSHLGVLLFERDNKGVELTEACRAFVEESRLSVLHLERAIHKARTISKGAEAVLHLGTSPSIDPYYLSALLSIRLPLFPKLAIYRSSTFSPELSRQVMTGELDLALLTAEPSTPKLNYLEIAIAPFYVVTRSSDPIATKRDVRLRDCNEGGELALRSVTDDRTVSAAHNDRQLSTGAAEGTRHSS